MKKHTFNTLNTNQSQHNGMTLELIILNQNRTFTAADSNVTINDCKTFEGEQKIFRITDRLSSVLLLSGNSEFDGQKMKNFIDEYVLKTDFNEIESIEEIKRTLNESIAKSSRSLTLDEYVESTFVEFEKSIEKSISDLDDKDRIIQFLKLNSFDGDVDFLNQNKTLDSNLKRFANSSFDIKSKDEFELIKFYLRQAYITFLINNSPNIVLVGYDEANENPTYIDYAMLLNNRGKIETIVKYSVHDCVSTMIFSIAQDNDVKLSLTGYNNNSYRDIRKIVLDLFEEFGNLNHLDQSLSDSIGEELKTKIDEIKLNNLENIIKYINMLPDSEILKLLDVLIVLTSVKMKFSPDVHSVGEKRIKAVLRKYCDVSFFK